MPKTLNPNNNFPASIPNFPLSGNNEPLALGPLEAAIQAVLDRTEHLHQSRLTVEGAGVKRIQKVASLAALQNLAGMSDGDVVDVEGYGRYRLYNPSALTADGLWVLTATGGGRWVHVLNTLRGANSGLATLTSGGRLTQDVRDNSILTAHLASGSVTAAKLAAGAVVSHLGYTPLYDYQNRFVFSSNSGFSDSLAAGNVLYLAIFPVYIPSGKSLYLRRARYYLSNPNLRLQVGDTSTFTSNNNNDDVTPNVIMSSTSGLRSVSVLIYNPTGSTQNMFPSDSCWLEFEIV